MRRYRAAVLEDLPRLLELARKARMKLDSVPSITFVCEEDGVIEAAMGLSFDGDLTVAGPFIIAHGSKHKFMMWYRLVKVMEQWMEKAGATQYDLAIARNNKSWNNLVQKSGADLYAVKDGRNWYTRRLGTL